MKKELTLLPIYLSVRNGQKSCGRVFVCGGGRGGRGRGAGEVRGKCMVRERVALCVRICMSRELAHKHTTVLLTHTKTRPRDF